MQENGYIFILYVLAFALFVFLMKAYSQSYLRKCVDCEKLNERPLYDLFHKSCADMRRFYWVGDVIITFIIAFAIYISACNGLDAMKVVLMLLVLQLIKIISTMVTILPDPSGNCSNKFLKEIFGNCNDLMFSGHTGLAFLILFIIKDYLSDAAFYVLVFNIIVLCVFTVITRNHYTVDVIMSFFVAYFIANVMN